MTKIMNALFFIVIALNSIVSSQTLESQNEPLDDTTGIVSVDSSLIEPEYKIEYIEIADTDSINLINYFPQTIESYDLSGTISHSLADIFELSTGFSILRQGPYGQTEFISQDGMPISKYIIGDFVFDYSTFNLPLRGYIDSRLIPIIDADLIHAPRMVSTQSHNSVYLQSSAISNNGAQTTAIMQKGDYGYSNTMIRFGSNIGTRSRLGFSASFKNSNGYVLNSKKNLENFRLHNSYQISERYHFDQDILFFTSKDSLRYLNDYYNYRAESKSKFTGLSLGFSSVQNYGLFNSINLTYQNFEESIRGNHDKYRQGHDLYKLKLQNRLDYLGWENNIEVRPYFKRITFDPEYQSFAGIEIADQSSFEVSPSINLNMSAVSDLNKYSDADLSFDFGAEYSTCKCLHLYGQFFRVSQAPTDYSIHAQSPDFAIPDLQGIGRDYRIRGRDDLSNAVHLGYSLGMSYDKHGIQANFYLKHSKIDNYIFWQEMIYGIDSVLFMPQLKDAISLSGGLDFSTKLFDWIDSRLAYSYNRLEDSQNNINLSVTPRHKISTSMTRGFSITRLNLNLVTAIEGIYHSQNYNSALNPVTLNDYFLLNLKVQFKIKSLTIYYNMDNILGTDYSTVYDYELSRGIWWGFVWKFIN